MDTCQWCGKPLVEVDNPMRREVRHRRGEGEQCPGPPVTTPFAEAGAIQYDRRPGWEDVLASVPPALAACPTCAGTWWTVGRKVRIAVGDYVRAAGGAEPANQEHRTILACAGCGYSEPGS